jgi:hypothetical protein
MDSPGDGPGHPRAREVAIWEPSLRDHMISASPLHCPLQGIALSLVVLAQFQGHCAIAEVQGSMEIP